MASYFSRLAPIERALKTKSVLLLGPRRTGKSSLLRNQIQPDLTFDLLRADTFRNLSFRPSLLRESILPEHRIVVIDEIQKLPLLMDEVHSLIEERGTRFVLTGSSARKLRRTHTSLMAGRASRILLHPFVASELGRTFDLSRRLHLGGLPPVCLQKDPNDAWQELNDYTGDYLKEEVHAEAMVRKIDAFSRFLSVAATTNGELLNFESVACDAQVPSRTIREYFALLEDTLVGTSLEPLRWKGSKSRKCTATAKFYFFDCGVLNALLQRRQISEDTPQYGNLFETWIFHELQTYCDYRKGRGDYSLQFWRSPNGDEVDFILNGEIAIEVKATRLVSDRHIKGLVAFSALSRVRRKIVVSRDRAPRRIGDVEILPWEHFIEALWDGEIF